jgi:mannose/cellobiose epimerase-like protein (N-acyl-D-glucosamine 2-epimerase family)
VFWALNDAPDVPPSCLTVLIGLANHAHTNGRIAYPYRLDAGMVADLRRQWPHTLAVNAMRAMFSGTDRAGDGALTEYYVLLTHAWSLLLIAFLAPLAVGKYSSRSR